ncbi:MAG: hypothetical protein HY010_01695 [Acidobacteria bacterium]|nr:hypothetical protein [Acidobacteriota bacterium]
MPVRNVQVEDGHSAQESPTNTLPIDAQPVRNEITNSNSKHEFTNLGAPLINDDAKSSYVLIRHNVRTYVSAGVVEVVQGRANAEAAMREYQNRQSPADAHEGWRFFLEKTGLRPGMDPAQATDARQRDLELRESKESAGNGAGIPSSLGHH